jgi:hypothetical protein
MIGIITENSELFKTLEKVLDRKISYIAEGEDEDTIKFEDGTSLFCIIKVIFDKQLEVKITTLDDYFNPVQEINLTL